MSGMLRNRGRRTGEVNRTLLGGLDRLFVPLLDRIDRGLATGSLDVTLPGGGFRRMGGRAPGAAAVVDLRHWRALYRLATGGSSGWYEAWVAGEWASPDPTALFELFVANRQGLGDTARARPWSRLARRIAHLARRNDRKGARQNVAYHYDLGNDFYAAWLDETLTYSSAIFADPAEPLEAAQHRKLAAILNRTATRPGDRILEIGCGWGSFARTASEGGRHVHGLTLSTEQAAHVRALGLPNVEVSLTDYRDATGTYDAIASIEMVEAVGEAYWPDYLAAVARLLKPGGRAAIQYIAIDDAIFAAYARNVDFIQSYVFPGGMLISESRFRAIAERAGLEWRDAHAFGLDYAETLHRWRTAFDRAEAEGRLPADLDAAFRNLWRYYLMYCEGGFRGGGITVAQVTLVKPAA
ncbi:SAM-dependent methyltransferase [Sphingomonas yantingensis]|uniref:Cyclopropane-fatty-acyl-phospholipid synthase n=1 Tax=Sphingomonas yantingensis TaxID=1241761 RepID=A0A7W9ANL8_9SPHN|nr:cyclopropane-fatty-acyl-phospholipid synthase family protein [Sphingomonas yantingensis]MBB5697705.1 cyclopropane-fatty-acyl-phospholipid synthase [Sphingomonas yantingensis]